MPYMTRQALEAYMDRWLEIGRANPWIRGAYDPPFTRKSFSVCSTREELKSKFDRKHPDAVGWCLGQAFVYQDICFIQQVNGGDEWLTIKHGIAFESISWGVVIAKGQAILSHHSDFDLLLDRLLEADIEDCRNLTY